MLRLPLVPLLLAAVALSAVPADASASCGGATRYVKAEICPPSAFFTASPTQTVPGETVQFDASRSTVGLPRTIVEYAWDFDAKPGDTASDLVSASPTASRTFATRGTYVVELTVTDSEGLSASHSLTVSVGSAPVADLVASDLAPLSLTEITLDASASHDDLDAGTIASYAFDLDGDDDFERDTEAVPTTTVSFATPGTHRVSVQVTDGEGRTAVDFVDVIVGNRAPVAALAAPQLALAGLPTVLSAAQSSDPDGATLDYRWDLDDDGEFETDGGSVSTLTHTWSASGRYPIAVQVRDASGATDTDVGEVVVKSAPTAALTATPQQPVAGDVVTFSAAGSTDPDGPIKAFTWDLDGDGVFERTTGTTPTVSTAFATAGKVTVRVRVVDSDDLTATASAPLTVKQPAGAGTPAGGGEVSGGEATGGGTTTGGGGATTAATATGADTTSGGTAGDAAGAATATPAATPSSPRAAAGPGATLDSRPIQKLRTILRSGLTLACRAPATTRCVLRIEVDKSTAKRLRLGRTTLLATATLRGQSAGTAAVKLSARARKALAGARSVRLVVRGTATAADGSATSFTRVVLARR